MSACCTVHLHDRPEPLAGARFCGCCACLSVLELVARTSPRTELCVRTQDDRIVCTADFLGRLLAGGVCLQGRFDPAAVRDAWVLTKTVLTAPTVFTSLRLVERRMAPHLTSGPSARPSPPSER